MAWENPYRQLGRSSDYDIIPMATITIQNARNEVKIWNGENPQKPRRVVIHADCENHVDIQRNTVEISIMQTDIYKGHYLGERHIRSFVIQCDNSHDAMTLKDKLVAI